MFLSELCVYLLLVVCELLLVVTLNFPGFQL